MNPGAGIDHQRDATQGPVSDQLTQYHGSVAVHFPKCLRHARLRGEHECHGVMPPALRHGQQKVDELGMAVHIVQPSDDRNEHAACIRDVYTPGAQVVAGCTTVQVREPGVPIVTVRKQAPSSGHGAGAVLVSLVHGAESTSVRQSDHGVVARGADPVHRGRPWSLLLEGWVLSGSMHLVPHQPTFALS